MTLFDNKHSRKNNGKRPTYQNMSVEMRRMYFRWAAMLGRCHRPRDPSYPRYGGKGIKVCARWQTSFDNFMEDMGYPSSPDLSLDRIDSCGNYEPSNCRWADIITQGNNRSGTHLIDVNGKQMTIAQAWRKFAHPKLPYMTFFYRVAIRNWPIELAFEPPGGIYGRKKICKAI